MSSLTMAGRGPRARYYAGANSLSVFSAQGSNPLQDCKVYGKGVTKVYDKTVKGYVYSISGGLQSKLQLPKDDSKAGLQLLHQFLVLQVFVPQGVHFSVELRVSDINNTRRKMYFSTSFSEIKSTPLHCQIPISAVIRNKWLSLAFHVADLFNGSFRGGVNFRSTDVILLGPVCKLRKIFTMRCRITDIAPKGYSEEGSEDSLPLEHVYAAGVDTCIQTFDMASLQLAVLNNNESHTEDSKPAASSELGLSARKVLQGKTENTRPVHVAFGTRMPLPLSTVQINTNLPHDKSPTFVKDRIGKVHFVSDPIPFEVKEPRPPSNMVARALSVASIDQETQRRKLDGGVLDSKEMKRNRTGQIGCFTHSPEEKDPSNSPHVIPGQPEVVSEESQIPVVQDPLPDSPKLTLPSLNMTAEVHVGVDTNNKSPSKWATRKREAQLRQQRKDNRLKEYKHSMYMDSPPDSPPRGWDRSPVGNHSNDITFSDHFLDGPWMNTQLNESVDADSENKGCYEEDEPMFDTQDHHFFIPNLSEDKKDVNGLHALSRMDSTFASEAKGVGDSFDSFSGIDIYGELDPSLEDMAMTMKAGSERSSFTLGPVRSVLDRSWQLPESDQHLSSLYSKVDRLPSPEHGSSIKSNGRPDEDLDLLYDPTLDCYYDPKTNRYYELKGSSFEISSKE